MFGLFILQFYGHFGVFSSLLGCIFECPRIRQCKGQRSYAGKSSIHGVSSGPPSDYFSLTTAVMIISRSSSVGTTSSSSSVSILNNGVGGTGRRICRISISGFLIHLASKTSFSGDNIRRCVIGIIKEIVHTVQGHTV